MKMGETKAVPTEARDDLLLIPASMLHTSNCTIARGQNNPKQAPKVVATPLPPLKEEKMGSIWPAIAAKAHSARISESRSNNTHGSSAR